MAFELNGLAIAEAPHDLPTRCGCGAPTTPRFALSDAPLSVQCSRRSCHVVYFQKPTAAGRIILAGHEVPLR